MQYYFIRTISFFIFSNVFRYSAWFFTCDIAMSFWQEMWAAVLAKLKKRNVHKI